MGRKMAKWEREREGGGTNLYERGKKRVMQMQKKEALEETSNGMAFDYGVELTIERETAKK